ncbi:hypothetical protein [Sphingobium sp. EM0848]|nr:hypothetical protein [Sphingobium sp. EM0848]
MDRYLASVLNRLTAKGPGWTILALAIIYGAWIVSAIAVIVQAI